MNLSRALPLCGILASTISLLLCSLPVSVSAAPLSSKMVPGDEAFQRVSKLTTEIHWYASLDTVEQLAQKEGKPIFWVHMLGPINGMT